MYSYKYSTHSEFYNYIVYIICLLLGASNSNRFVGRGKSVSLVGLGLPRNTIDSFVAMKSLFRTSHLELFCNSDQVDLAVIQTHNDLQIAIFQLR